jgi:voltage-gated potassium channel
MAEQKRPVNEMDEARGPWLGGPVELFIQVLIIYSLVTFALETMPELAEYEEFFAISEAVVVILFTGEYFVRWGLARNKLLYPLRPIALVDLAAILPFYLLHGFDLRAVRVLRLLRILRVFKLGRYTAALQRFGDAFRQIIPELTVFGLIALSLLLLAATGIYYAEHEAQPDKFSSIPEAMWWSIVTMTTVGYGDIYPITPLGRAFASLVMIIGIGTVAVPTGLISSALTEQARKRRETDGGPPA